MASNGNKDSGVFIRLDPEQVKDLMRSQGTTATSSEPEHNGTVTVHETRIADDTAEKLRAEGRREIADRVRDQVANIIAQRTTAEKHQAELDEKDAQIARLERTNRRRVKATRRAAHNKAIEAKAAKAKAEAEAKAAAEAAKNRKLGRRIKNAARILFKGK